MKVKFYAFLFLISVITYSQENSNDQPSDENTPVINSLGSNCISNHRGFVRSTSSTQSQIYKRIILRKDGLTLSNIPQYGYKEDVYFEIENLSNDDSEEYVFAYKYLEEMDQPFLIHKADGFAERVNSRGNIFFKIPTFNSEDFRDINQKTTEEYVQSKNKEAFLIYNLLKVSKVVDESCLNDKERRLGQLVVENEKEFNKIDELTSWLNTYPKQYAENENADSIRLAQRLNQEINALDTAIERYTKEIEVVEKQIEFYQSNYYLDGAPISLASSYRRLLSLKPHLASKTSYRTNRSTLKAVVDARNVIKKNQLIEEAKKTSEYRSKNTERDSLKKELKSIFDLQEEISELQLLPKAGENPSLDVLKLGAIVKGNKSKTVGYEMGYRKSIEDKANNLNQLDLKRMGNFPILNEKDHVYAAIVNRIGQYGKDDKYRKLEGANYNLRLSIIEKDSLGVSLIDGPRPTSDLEGKPTQLLSLQSANEKDAETKPNYSVSTHGKIYQDLLLHFGKTFRRNSVIRVSFWADTYVPKRTTSAEGKVTEGVDLKNKLLLKEVYPQIRGLYRFNVTTGIVSSFVKRNHFMKVPVSGASSGSAFAIEHKEISDPRILPMLALTVHWKQVDIQRPPSWTEMIPNPTIGFDFTQPTNEIFLGFSSEFVRNIQLVYGLHFTKVDQLSANQDLTSSTTPNVDKTFERGIFVGLTFNFNLIPSMYNQFFKKEG